LSLLWLLLVEMQVRLKLLLVAIRHSVGGGLDLLELPQLLPGLPQLLAEVLRRLRLRLHHVGQWVAVVVLRGREPGPTWALLAVLPLEPHAKTSGGGSGNERDRD
jgi:hypothetical protein